MEITHRIMPATAALAGAAVVGRSVPTASPTAPAPTPALPAGTPASDRAYWVALADRLARPVLVAQKEGRLKDVMYSRQDAKVELNAFAPLEAFALTLAGIAPWLEGGGRDGQEGRLREELAALAREGLRLGTDPNSPKTYLDWGVNGEPLVDAAYLVQAILRAPNELWGKLDQATRANVSSAIARTRAVKPWMNNWLLFSAMVEAGLYRMTGQWNPEPVEFAISKHKEWYKGDGVYGDGPMFHWDYYNSYVIHPMMIDVLEVLGQERPAWEKLKPTVLARARRFAAIQERMISPEGAYPPIGRSLTYRFGAFHLLGLMALRKQLPEGVSPAQVRCALNAVIRRTAEFPGMFDGDGFLTVGVCGRQTKIADFYISPGTMYMCVLGLLPLGLPPSDEFWTAPAADWTSKRLWSGQEIPIDHAENLE